VLRPSNSKSTNKTEKQQQAISKQSRVENSVKTEAEVSGGRQK